MSYFRCLESTKGSGQLNDKIQLALTYLPLFCMALILVGCADLPDPTRNGKPAPTPLPFSCDMFTEENWRELRFGVDTPEEYVETVERVWGVELWTIPLFRDGYTSHWGRWNADSSVSPGLEYRVQFDRAAKLLLVAAFWGGKISAPTLVQVIDCLGTPEYYIAAFVEDRTGWLKFSLWYVEKGFVIHGSSSRWQSYGRLDWPTIKPGTSMWGGGYVLQEGDFIVVVPGDLEQMVSAAHGPALQAWELCLIRPWPGSIEAIEILSYEEYLRCAT